LTLTLLGARALHHTLVDRAANFFKNQCDLPDMMLRAYNLRSAYDASWGTGETEVHYTEMK